MEMRERAKQERMKNYNNRRGRERERRNEQKYEKEAKFSEQCEREDITK